MQDINISDLNSVIGGADASTTTPAPVDSTREGMKSFCKGLDGQARMAKGRGEQERLHQLAGACWGSLSPAPGQLPADAPWPEDAK